jgi:NADPH:quinone reductase-like Zn-dependent oxidoreductase
MKAYIVDPQAAAGVRLTDAPEPQPAPNEALVGVEAFALNRGELPRGEMFAVGSVPGWDAAGRVIAAAADGSGPGVGARVVTNGGGGAWAERRAVDTAKLAAIPNHLDFERASALPVAGGTALQALRTLGGCVGRRVLITGAAGGVGRIALQLARRAGAEVVAWTSLASRRAELERLGAAEVVSDAAALTGPLFGVIETVGGATLVAAWGALRPGGTLASVGSASGEAAAFAPYATIGAPRTLLSFNLGSFTLPDETLGEDLAYLANLAAAGELDPQIVWRGSWSKLDVALDGLANRAISGKAVLTID